MLETSPAQVALLPDRGVIAVGGADTRKFLQGLITNDIDALDRNQPVYAGLLSPQGKILFDFIIIWDDRNNRYLLDVEKSKAAELIKRLSMYRLRAVVVIDDLSDHMRVAAAWGPQADPIIQDCVAYHDPRSPQLGMRRFLDRALDPPQHQNHRDAATSDYHDHRIALGVPQAGLDYALGDTFPHEAGFDRFNGVSFTKGCYVGQEVVSRMQNKSVVRKRVVRITVNTASMAGSTSCLAPGTAITVSGATIGTIGSVTSNGTMAMAMVRLDRASEARQKNIDLMAGDAIVAVDPLALAQYEAAAVEKRVSIG